MCNNMLMKKRREEKVDRLSSLPNHILINIISLRPLKSAIATEILSRRWHHLWTHLIAIHFDNLTHDFFTPFDQIMQKLVSPLIHTFTLKFSRSYVYSSYHQPLLDSWIRHVCQRDVRHLNVECDPPLIKHPFEAPACVVQTTSLLSIKLRPEFWFNGDPITLLPNLKKLDICVVSSQWNWLGKLIAVCPLLEELSVEVKHVKNESCETVVVVVVNCSNPNLKKLSMKIPYDRFLKKMVIDAPKLEYLFVRADKSSAIIVFCDKPVTLQEAEVTIHRTFARPINNAQQQHHHQQQQQQQSNEHIDLCQGIINVRILTLKFDYYVVDTSTLFSKLTHLRLLLSQRDEIDKLLKFLALCPLLNALILDFHQYMDDEGSSILITSSERTFGQVALKSVDIVTIYCLDAQRSLYFSALTKYVLGNAPSLDHFGFTVEDGCSRGYQHYRQPLNEEQKSSFMDTISKFSRASPSCKVVFRGRYLAIPPEDDACVTTSDSTDDTNSAETI